MFIKELSQLYQRNKKDIWDLTGIWFTHFCFWGIVILLYIMFDAMKNS